MSRRDNIQRIVFRVSDTAGNKNILSIVQGGSSYGSSGKTVEVAYYTIDSESFPDVISFVTLRELAEIISDVTRGATPDEIEEKYTKNFDDRED
jgi:hypothetical protein